MMIIMIPPNNLSCLWFSFFLPKAITNKEPDPKVSETLRPLLFSWNSFTSTSFLFEKKETRDFLVWFCLKTEATESFNSYWLSLSATLTYNYVDRKRRENYAQLMMQITLSMFSRSWKQRRVRRNTPKEMQRVSHDDIMTCLQHLSCEWDAIPIVFNKDWRSTRDIITAWITMAVQVK